MYLKGKRYLSEYFNKEDKARKEDIQKLFPELDGIKGHMGENCVSEVQIDAGYWRKANAVHAWFVRECQGGDDDCGYYYVDREQLTELKALCQRVIDFKHLANELLPVQSGFFFGNTDYDDYYFQYLQATVEIVDNALKLPTDWEFQYHSSW
jgi:hypothetical protein